MAMTHWLHSLMRRTPKPVRRRSVQRIETLEDRALLTPNLKLLDVDLVDADLNRISSITLGEKIGIKAVFQTDELPSDASYKVAYTVNGVTKHADLSFGAGRPGIGTWNWTITGWFAESLTTHMASVTLDSGNDVSESNENDNTLPAISFNATKAILPQKFIWPVEGEPFKDILITNYVDLDPSSGIRDYQDSNAAYDGHDALDAGPEIFELMDRGIEIVAAADGEVIAINEGEYDRQTGQVSTPSNYVILDHGGGWTTYYAHLRRDSVTVKIGQSVSAGDVLGYMGSSGRSTAPHIHFGVQHNGRTVEPYLDQDTFFVEPMRYVGDEATVVLSGVTNYAPTAHHKERPSDVDVFPQAAGQVTYAWAQFNGLRKNDVLSYVWRRPNGSIYTTTFTTLSRDYSNSWWWWSRSLPAVPDIGTWTIDFNVNGAKIGERIFEVTPTGAPEIRVEDNTSPSDIILDGRYTPIDFGTAIHRLPGPRKSFKIVNHGSGDLTIDNLTVPHGFTIVDGLDGNTLSAGATEVFTVGLNTSTAGYFAGEVRFTTNDADEGDYSFSVEGLVDSSVLKELTFGISERFANEGTRFVANVRRTGSTSTSQVVALSSAPASLLSLPSTVTIPAGDEFVNFFIETTNEVPGDTPQRLATLTATATGFSSAHQELLIGDAVESLSPIDDAVDVAKDTTLEIQFREPVFAGRGTLQIRRFSDDAVVQTVDVSSPDVAIASDRVTIDPGSLSLLTKYYVQIPPAAFEDADGNDMVGISSKTAWNFTIRAGAFEVTESGAVTSVSEAATSDTLQVVLSVPPSSNVVLKITSEDIGEAIAAPASLTFTPSNWDESQTVTVTGVDDAIVDGDQNTTITVWVDSALSDDAFDAVPHQTVIAETIDDDSPELTLSLAESSVSEGSTGTTATVSRNTSTASALTVTLASDDASEASAMSTVTIPAGDRVSQPFDILAVDDHIVDGTQSLNITAIAAGHAAGTATLNVTDDDTPELSISLNSTTIGEEDGNGATSATVSRNTDTTTALTVTLVTSDVSEAVVPSTVTIPAGQLTSPLFAIDGIDDDIVDGTQSVTLTATALNHSDGVSSLSVTDDDLPLISLTIAPTSVSEAAGAAAANARVSRNTDTAFPLIVMLESGDTSELTVPATITIPAGERVSSPFDLDSIDDDALDGPQTVTVAVTALGHNDGFASIVVTDNEIGSLTLTIQSGAVSEADGAAATTATVSRDTAVAGPLIINLTSSDQGELVVPARITIPAGHSVSAPFDVGAVDDEFVDGSRIVTIAAMADLHATASESVAVNDDDVPALRLNIAAPSLLESDGASATTATVSRNTDTSTSLIVSLVSGDTSELTVPSSVTIPPGQWISAPFVIGVSDNGIVDGTRSIAVTAGATGHPDATETVQIVDDDLPQLTLSVDVASIREDAGQGATTARVSRNTDSTAPLIVAVTSSDPDTLTVPVAVTIPSGQMTSAPFSLDVVDDSIVDGDQIITLTAEAGGHADGSAVLEVTDDDIPTLTLTVVAPTVSEAAGPTATTAFVSRNSDTAGPLTVTVTSDDESEARVPAVITIPAGLRDSAPIDVTAIDDAIVDGTQHVTISASASGFASGSDSLAVADDDVPGLEVEIASTAVREDAGVTATTATVRRNTDTAAPLTVRLISSDESELTVPAVITISAGQRVSAPFPLAAVDDVFVDGAQSVSIQATAPEHAGGTGIIEIADDDTAGLSIIESEASTVVTESGTTDSFGVVLASGPLTDVVVMVVRDDVTEASIDVRSLRFTSENWDEVQTVSVTGLDDDVDDGNQTTTVSVRIDDDESHSAFNAVQDLHVSVTTIDDDTAGFTIVESDGSTAVAESGEQDSFSIVLNSRPDANVVFAFASGDPGEVSVLESTLTFTPGNWNVAQTVVVAGEDDVTVDGAVTSRVTVSVDDASTLDPLFDSLPDQVVVVTTTDDDTTLFTIDESGGSTSVTEQGSTDSFTVVLDSRPLSDVVLQVSNGDATEVSVAQSSLTFTPDNWHQPQSVDVTGTDDALVDGTQQSAIVLMVDAAKSNDFYDATPSRTVFVTAADDELPGYEVRESGAATTVSEARNADTFTVVLTEQPAGDVVFDITSSDSSEAILNTSLLRFTPADWNATKTVAVYGVDDEVADGDQSSTVTVALNSSLTHAAYQPLPSTQVVVTTTDNERPGIVISETDNTTVVEENSSGDQVSVSLRSEPVSDVRLLVETSSTELIVDQSSLLFTPRNWSVPQAVQLSVVDDAIAEDRRYADVTFAVDGNVSAEQFRSVAPLRVRVEVVDDDEVGLAVTGNPIEVSETGTQGELSVRLTSRPASNVVLAVDPDDPSEVSVSTRMLTFTPSTWSVPQIITVTGTDDLVTDGVQHSHVVIAVDNATPDTAYSMLPPHSASVTTSDDDVAGVLVTETDGSCEVSEDQTTDSFAVRLARRPVGDVMIELASEDEGEVQLSRSFLTFTPDNWDVDQEVTISGVDDASVDGSQEVHITVAVDAAQSDPAYASVADHHVRVANADNETAGFALSSSHHPLKVIETGTSDVFHIALTAQPGTDVILDLSSSDSREASVRPQQVIFTPENWHVPQAATVTGVDDVLDDADQSSMISVEVNSALSDEFFVDLPIQTISVDTLDDEGSSIQVHLEGATDVVINADTHGNLTVELSGDGLGSVLANGAPMTGPVAASNVSSIVVAGSALPNVIDLQQVTSSDFSFINGVAIAIHSGGGNDHVFGSEFADRIVAGGGSDVVVAADGADSVYGGAGKDILDGGSGNDRLFGQGGTGDILIGAAGDDLLDGGSGNDLVSESVPNDLTLTTTSMVGLGMDTVRSLERARLTGNSSSNRIDVSGFLIPGMTSTTLLGGGGDDVLVGSAGNDVLRGHGGDDLVLAGPGNDRVFGGSGGDTLRGEAGNDRLLGQGGSGDNLDGGAGLDFLHGGRGIDRVAAQADTNFVLTDEFLDGDGRDTFRSIEAASLSGGPSDNTIDVTGYSGRYVIVAGNAGHDLILGGDTVNIFAGGSGDDTLQGGPRSDKLKGNAGNDLIFGGGGNDSLDGGADNDTLLGQAGVDNLNGGRGNDGLSGGDGSDFLNGWKGHDLLLGGRGDDHLEGFDGSDILIGGVGIDTLLGQTGADRLVRGTGLTAETADTVDDPGELDDFFMLNRVYTWIDEI